MQLTTENHASLSPALLQPREKLIKLGAGNLSDQELLSVLLGTGVNGRPVHAVAKELVAVIDGHGDELDVELFQSVHGVGPAKAMLMVAAFEFSRRRLHSNNTRIRSPQDVLRLVSHLADRKQEHLIAITLNGAHEVITSRIISVGTANSAVAHPREIFSGAITDSACALVLAHNHPSGNVEPSTDDLAVTARIKDAGTLLGISLLDHIIFSRQNFYSFKDSGTL